MKVSCQLVEWLQSYDNFSMHTFAQKDQFHLKKRKVEPMFATKNDKKYCIKNSLKGFF